MFRLGIIASAIKRALGFLLDTYPNAAAAYSLRKLRNAYAGSAIRVRRSIDNTESDIGFDVNGNLDESALTAFVGNGNAFTYSEQFDNGIWGKNSVTVTANQTTAPDGTTTADLIAETAVSGNHSIQNNNAQIFTSGRYYTLSIYLKKGTGATAPNFMQLTFQTGSFGTQYANFNINTGTIVQQVNGTATITAAANGFYRCTFTALCTTSGSGSTHGLVFTNNSNIGRLPTYTGSTTSDVFAWGSQLNEGSTAQTYVATTANQAGFGYVTKWYNQSGTPVNLFPYSEQFDNAAWFKSGATVTANQTTAPDGTTTADLVSETATTAAHNFSYGATIAVADYGKIYTASVYLKKGTGATAPDIIQMRLSTQMGSGYANFNISTGSVTLQSGCTATITNIGSGWYRCSVTSISGATSGGNTLRLVTFCQNNPTASATPSYAGATTSDVFAWGAQLVVGSDPLTYTKTEATAGARDATQTTAANQPRIVNAGVVEKQGSKPTVVFDGTNDVLNAGSVLISAQPNSTIALGRNYAGTGFQILVDGVLANPNRQFIYSGSVDRISYSAGTNYEIVGTTMGTTQKLFFATFNSPNSTLYSNSNLLTTQNIGTNNLSGIRMGAQGGSLALYWNGNINEIISYPSDQSSNRTGIESNINSYYNIY